MPKNMRDVSVPRLTLLLAIMLLLVGAWWWGGYYCLNGQIDSLSEVNLLRTELGQPRIEVDPEAFLPWQVWAEYFKAKEAVAKLASLQEAKQKVIDEFEVEVESYFSKVSQTIKADLPNVFQETDYGSVGFQEKKTPGIYLAQRKAELRSYLLEQNSDGRIVKRWLAEPNSALKEMSLRRKVAQMFSVTVSGTELSQTELNMLKKYQPGGVVLLGSNVANQQQLRNLTDSIQATNPAHLVFVMVDQEGGTVKRVWWDNSPGAKLLASMGEDAQCEQLKTRQSVLLKSGINFNLGTMADVTSDASAFIYPRVYGSSFSEVKGYVARSLRCAQKILNTIKHYPGHGATSVDTHQQLAHVTLTLDKWTKTHLLPFTAASDKSAIMLGHIVLPAVDPNQPASLSAKHVDYLRNNLNFSGILITDDMLMLEAAGRDRLDSARRAVRAGQDILLYATDIRSIAPVIDNIVNEIKAKKLDEAKVDQAVSRLILRKNELLEANGSPVPSELLY